MAALSSASHFWEECIEWTSFLFPCLHGEGTRALHILPISEKGCVQDPLYPCPYPVLQVRFPMLSLWCGRGVQPCLIPISCRAALFQHSCIHNFFVMPFGSSHHRWLFGGEEVCSVPCLDVVLTDLLGSPCFLLPAQSWLLFWGASTM